MRRNLSTEGIETRGKALGLYTIFVRPHTAAENEQLAVLLDHYEETGAARQRKWPMAAKLLPKGMRFVTRSEWKGRYGTKGSIVHVITDNRAQGVEYPLHRELIAEADPMSMVIVPVHWDRVISQKVISGYELSDDPWGPDTVRMDPITRQWHIINGEGTSSLTAWSSKERALAAAAEVEYINPDHGIVWKEPTGRREASRA